MNNAPRNRKQASSMDCQKIDTLIGLCKGMIADNHVCQAEAEFLLSWLIPAAASSNNPVIHTLLERVETMLEDGVLDTDESRELLVLLTEIGSDPSEIGEIGKTSTLPLCKPTPEITLEGKTILFTGTFAYGPRKDCVTVTEAAGGIIAKSVTKKLDYLVIGHYVTESWKHENFGNKISKAMEYRDSGTGLHIISEGEWSKQTPAEK